MVADRGGVGRGRRGRAGVNPADWETVGAEEVRWLVSWETMPSRAAQAEHRTASGVLTVHLSQISALQRSQRTLTGTVPHTEHAVVAQRAQRGQEESKASSS